MCMSWMGGEGIGDVLGGNCVCTSAVATCCISCERYNAAAQTDKDLYNVA